MTDEDKTSAPGTARRPLLRLAAGGAALVTVGATARLTLHPGDDEPSRPEPGALSLTTQEGSDVASLHLPLGEDLLPRVGSRRWESQRLPTTTHSMVALTWPADEPAPAAHVRSRTGGRWGAWTRLPVLHDLPEDEVGTAPDIAGTDLVWIGRADGVQVRVEGRRAAGLQLVLLHPAKRASDPFLGQEYARAAASDPTKRAPRPKLITREEWGANEKLRDGRPQYIDSIRQVHVHHTVNANDYAKNDVPALIRGMYAYHTQTLGWSDIGYNFLVDRFGRGFVGRAGGPAKLVRGAHTLGFNHNSAGISAIGNYETKQPTSAMLDAIAAIAAWKLDRFDRNPRSKISVTSEGSDKFASGRTVKLPVIDGHRDTNDTACPGQHLYDALPKIRKRTARIIAASREVAIQSTAPPTLSGTVEYGELLRADPGSWTPSDAVPTYRWLRGDDRIQGAREQTYQLRMWDIGHTVRCEVTLSRPDSDPVVRTTPATPVVRARPTLRATTSVKRRIVTVELQMTSPDGVKRLPDGGTITVEVGTRTGTATMKDGRARVRFGHRKMKPGRYPVVARYSGDARFTGARDEARVRVE